MGAVIRGRARTILAVLDARQALQTSIVERSEWLSGDSGHCGCGI